MAQTDHKQTDCSNSLSLEALPTEIIVHILSYLSLQNVVFGVSLVNHDWHAFANADFVWKSLFFSKWKKTDNTDGTVDIFINPLQPIDSKFPSFVWIHHSAPPPPFTADLKLKFWSWSGSWQRQYQVRQQIETVSRFSAKPLQCSHFEIHLCPGLLELETGQECTQAPNRCGTRGPMSLCKVREQSLKWRLVSHLHRCVSVCQQWPTRIQQGKRRNYCKWRSWRVH